MLLAMVERHPRRADQARRAHAGAALPDQRRSGARARRPRAKRRTCSRRSPIAWASGNSSGSSRTWRCARSSPRPTSKSRSCSTSAASIASTTSRTSRACSSASSRRPASRRRSTGRPKHIYSIWNKMRRKQSGIDSLYDIRAVRILVDEVKDCYTALGVVHNLWTPLAREFDDYIAKPKANDYRSLHTAVIGPDDKPLEVQIRTHEMHAALRVRRRRALALQGRRRTAAARPRLRREDRVAAPGARLEGRGRRAAASGCSNSSRACSPTRSTCSRRRAGDRPAARRDAGRLRLLGAHQPRAPLPRRARRRRDGAAQLPAAERSAGRDHRGQAGRSVARLAQSRPGLRAQPPRARQGAPMVQGAATRGNHRAGPQRWSSASSRARA